MERAGNSTGSLDCARDDVMVVRSRAGLRCPDALSPLLRLVVDFNQANARAVVGSRKQRRV